MHATVERSSSLARLKGLLTLMRPRQWVKNGFVFAPLLFTGSFLHGDAIRQVLMAALLFCVASSATYIVNDLHDIERDRRHPKKSRTRPLASGLVTPAQALVLLAILYAVLIGAWLVAPAVIVVIAGYMVLNLAYTFLLKHQPVLDIFTIAIGFVLRVYAGAMALSVPVSSWMFVTTLCLALYLAAVKRRQELAGSGSEGREVLRHYTPALIDRYAEMAATGALLFYSLFVISARPEMVVTIPLVLFGLFRYWFVVESLGGGESPTDALLSDWQLLVTVALWVGVSAWAIWPA
ncbi:decaprenyl-phosphate phosphoribosyltransferase [Pseudomonas mangiferae]|uniref:Decaprenyl-phosphate phosphoribosyltransferase n=1 Tax=Pseudomonas mangiferae TaxID=2593654 RepID=A0A553GTP8_9PSED|nr:decaprenyl-phosphate phosphoribosyltransferase [Pseudomonas mangiferae]TRX72863.1 decaprenyl-phosphate phosphoribosyltransferase [Pseudomonas mangiferae]